MSEKTSPQKVAWAAGAVAGSAALAYAVYECSRSKKFKEPGTPLPWLGHMHLFDYKNIAWELERLRTYVNDKVMGLWLGPDYMVYVTTPALTHKVFAEHGDKSSGRSVKMPAALDIGNHGIVLNEGVQWKKNRQLILRELIGSKERAKVVCQVFDELTATLGVAASSNQDGKVQEFAALIHKTITSAMCMMIFGFRLEDKLVDEILEHVDYIGAKAFDYMMIIRLPFYKLIPKSFEYSKTVQQFEHACQRMIKIVDEIVVKRMQSEEYKAKGMKSIVQDPCLSEVLFEAVQGGVDTTTAVLEWCVAYLADTPEFQKRIHEELDTVCGPNGPQMEDEAKLVLLNAAIMETLRMAQISSIVAPHKATEPIDLGGNYKKIPKGATLFWSFNQMHGDPELWGDPWVFRPDRFMIDFPGLTTNPNTALTSTGEFKKYMPFGIGPRHCPGYKLATYELYIGLSKLLWEYEFSSTTKVDQTHYTTSIPVRVKGFVPTVRRRVKAHKKT